MTPAPFVLPPTKTHPRPGDRVAHWFPAGRGWEFDGILAVGQGSKAATYEVQEDDSEPFPGRRWLLNKRSDRSGDVREVTSGPDGWRCSCEGWTCHRGEFRCVHTDALRAVFGASEPVEQVA